MTDNTPAKPAPTCTEGYESLKPWWIVRGPGPLAGFKLRLDTEGYTVGDELTVELRNVADGYSTSGNKNKYDVQRHGPDGWHTILGTSVDEDFGWTDEGISHPSGKGFTWRFTLTREGLSGQGRTGSGYHVCEPITPGTYRFVYWGIVIEREGEAGVETDYALGVPFHVHSTR